MFEEKKPLKMDNPTDYIKISEIAKFFDVNEDDARVFVKSAYFPSLKFGSKNFIVPRVAFMKFITDPDKIIEYKLRTYYNERELDTILKSKERIDKAR